MNGDGARGVNESPLADKDESICFSKLRTTSKNLFNPQSIKKSYCSTSCPAYRRQAVVRVNAADRYFSLTSQEGKNRDKIQLTMLIKIEPNTAPQKPLT
jgi:hypothetical protein